MAELFIYFFLTFKEKKNPAFLTGKKFKIPYGYGLVKTQSNFLREHLTEKQPLTYFGGTLCTKLILMKKILKNNLDRCRRWRYYLPQLMERYSAL